MNFHIVNKIKIVLSKPIDTAILGFYRIAFGIVMLIQFHSIKNYFTDELSQHSFFFKYDGFEWIQLLPLHQLELFFVLIQLSAICFILGLFTRIQSILLFLGWTYLFLLDRGHYNNHYYFYSLVLFLFSFVDADGFASLKSTKSKKRLLPYWQLFVFQLQIFIVYFFGGIAKLDMDWLLGHPMMNILPNHVQHFPSMIATLLSSKSGAIFFSYFGLFFDLFIGFMLFSKRFRYWALLPISLFHIANHFLWTIGTFPWAMLASTGLFFNPSWPRNFVKFIKVKFGNQDPKFDEIQKNVTIELVHDHHSSIEIKNRMVYFLMFYFFLQFTIPFRHLLYPGDAAWTGQGHLFAWRMMLTNSDDAIRLKVKLPKERKEFYVDLLAYMSRFQLNKITKTPKMMLKFVHFIRDEIIQHGGGANLYLHLEMYKSVNYRSAKLLNDTSLNYANVPYEIFENASWILPYKRHSSDLREGIHDSENWDSIFNQ